MRSDKLILAIAFTATAAAFNGLQAADLTVSADQTLAISSPTSYDNLILENSATLTLISNGNVLDITGAISGTGTIELNKGKIGIYADVPSTVAWKITGTGTVTAENRIISRVAGSDKIKKIEGPLTGTGSVRVMGSPEKGIGGISVAGDNSSFEGKLIIGKNSYNRLGAAVAGSAKMSLEYDGNFGHDGSPDFSGGTLEFGSIYTTSRTTGNYPWRFNDGEYTLKVGALNKLDDRISIKLGESYDSTGKVRIEKVGTGTLELWNVNNRRGIDINDGTVLVTSDGALSNNSGAITFGGGTLKYGVNNWADDGTALETPIPVTTDYSAQIKNSTAAISIDTGDNNVTFASALDASNVGGLVKKGKGALVLVALPKYTGKTVVEEGSLTIPVNDTTLTAENFEVKNGAEITYVNNHTYQITDKLGTIGETATVNFLPNSSWRLWRCMAYPFGGADFKGTINFANKGISSSVDGIMNDTASVGNSNVVWGVTGEPEEDNTLLLYIQGNTGGTSKGYLGALRQTSDKGVVSIYRNMPVIEIGNRADVDSVLNGAWMERTTSGKTTAATIRKIGKGKLVLGTRFRAISINDTKLKNGNFTDNDKDGSVYYPTFQIVDGTFENNADLSTGFTVDLSEASANVVLCGSGTWPENMTLPASYKVAAVAPGETPETLDIDVDFSKATLANEPTVETVAELDKSQSYTIFSAKSISNWKSKEIATIDNGKWKVARQGNSLVLKYSKMAFVIIFR